MALALITFVLIFLGGGLASDVFGKIGLGDTAATVWLYLRWPAALVVAMTIYAIVYYAAPNVEVRHFRWITPGAVVGVVLWIIASRAVLRLRLELLVLLGDLRRVRGRGDPARVAVGDERGAALRRRAQRGGGPAAGGAPAGDV